MVGNGFQGANQWPRNKKVWPTLEVARMFTPFAQKYQSLIKLLNSAMDSGVGGICYSYYILGLEMPTRPSTKAEPLTRQPKDGYTAD